MRWKTRRKDAWNPYDWHPWFAWKPIEVGAETVWMEFVERRLGSYLHNWEHRLVDKTWWSGAGGV